MKKRLTSVSRFYFNRVFFIMRFLAILFLIITNLYAFQSVASTGLIPSVKSNLASQSLLLGITKASEDKVVIVGARGHILTSSDGSHWQQANVPMQVTLTNVYFYNENLGWAVGHDASILHTTDGGDNWLVQYNHPELEKPLFDINFSDPLHGFAVGAYGLVLRTKDGGKNWASEFHQELLLSDDIDYLNELKIEDEEAYLDESAFILPHFNRLVRDGRTLYLLGEIGLLAKSNDFGVTWQKLSDIYQGSFFDLGRTKAGNLIVVGLRGHIFRGIKNGLDWSEQASQTTASLNDVVLSNDERIFILGNNGVLLESTDDGKTFQLRIQEDGKALIAGTWFKGKLIAVSEVGVKTLDLP